MCLLEGLLCFKKKCRSYRALYSPISKSGILDFAPLFFFFLHLRLRHAARPPDLSASISASHRLPLVVVVRALNSQQSSLLPLWAFAPATFACTHCPTSLWLSEVVSTPGPASSLKIIDGSQKKTWGRKGWRSLIFQSNGAKKNRVWDVAGFTGAQYIYQSLRNHVLV